MILLKTTVYDKLVEKVNKIDTSGFVLLELEKEILDVSGLVKKQATTQKVILQQQKLN